MVTLVLGLEVGLLDTLERSSEPEGEAGSLAAGDAGRLPRSGTSKARSLRAISRGFFFFSAS